MMNWNFLSKTWMNELAGSVKLPAGIAQAQQRWQQFTRRGRVPLRRQLTMVECGPTCLAMILSYFGRPTRVSEVRDRCGLGRDGVTARTLAEAARSFGLRVRAYSTEPEMLPETMLPAIAHWKFNHFVVLEKWTPREVTIVDPGLGRRSISSAEFNEAFTGVVLTMEPGAHFQRQSGTRASWPAYLWDLMHTSGAGLVLGQILLASILLQLLGLTIPLLTKLIVDQVLPLQIESLMGVLGLGLLIVVSGQLILSYLRAAFLVHLQGRLDAQLMLGFFEHILSLPYRFFQQRSSGDLLMRLGSNAVIRETLTSNSLAMVLDGVFVLAYLAMLLVLSPKFGLLALGLALVQVVLLLATTRRVQALTQEELATQAISQSYLVEALNGIASLKAAGTEDRVLDYWTNLFTRQLNVSLQRSQLSAIIETVMNTLRTFTPLLLLWVGASQVLAGQMSLGTMLALNTIAIAFLTPLSSLVSNGRSWQLVGAHLERLTDVWEAEPEQTPGTIIQSGTNSPPSGRIELRQVNFRYDEQAPLALNGISLDIAPGQKVALVGRTGSGKSTLGMLLLGLYQANEGQIRFDDQPITNLDVRWLRRHVGAVLQDTFLFSGSIRQNIAFHDPELPFARIIEAAKAAEIHEDIMAMPMAYETLLSEGGVGLSGGQRQRLALARALVRRPTILLLDEATSQLDALTEARVDLNLEKMTNTRIVIAHRLSTVRNADQIFVLEQGAIVEQGTHEELMARGGHYAALVHGQRE